jgi:hypothetical protein
MYYSTYRTECVDAFHTHMLLVRNFEYAIPNHTCHPGQAARERCAEPGPTGRQACVPKWVPGRSASLRARDDIQFFYSNAVSTLYRGRLLEPIRNSSTARAAWRPSRIAQTTSDCPRRMSPQAKTRGVELL